MRGRVGVADPKMGRKIQDRVEIITVARVQDFVPVKSRELNRLLAKKR